MDKVFSSDPKLTEFLFQISPIGLLTLNESGSVLNYNSYFINIFGAKNESYFQSIHSPFFQKIGITDIFIHCKQTLEPIFSEINFSQDEKEIYLQILFIPYEKTEEGYLYEALFVDITRKKENEKMFEHLNSYYHKLLSGLPPVATMNENFVVKYVNESFQREFGKRNENFVGNNFLDIFQLNEKQKKELKKNLQKSQKTKIQNRELQIGEKIFGYSLFQIETDLGIILRDITETRGLEKKIEYLYSELIKLQETERQKIARELHDSVGQTILAAKLNLNAYYNDKNRSEEKFKRALELIDTTSQELREIYSNLYPSVLRELGLEIALRSLIKNMFTDNFVIHFLYEIDSELKEEFKLGIYRIVQEICTNIVKHSKATEVFFHFFENQKKIFIVVDEDGGGFDLTQKNNIQGLGLNNLKFRAEGMGGDFQIFSAPNRGTSIQIRLPL
ncbi:MAG: histidine kinase [Candidatus Pacearchaeota archaeon]